MSLGILYVPLGEVSVQVLCPFFKKLDCLSSWYGVCEFFIYFGDQTLVRGITGKYFFLYSCFLFILLMFSLAMQKVFNLMKSQLFSLSFISLALGEISVKILLCGISEVLLFIFRERVGERE